MVEERDLREVGGKARLWRHEKNGAEVLSICNKDENKCFGANFYTPPRTSNGIAHILEHSVLCGSEKYPVKEPFVELLKGSLQTFLNAFTFPDKTCYPVASANLQDFYNLVDVYLDAVFHPRLNKNVLAQEGWHLEMEDMEAPWSLKGVVFNEMKGVYSSADSMLGEKSQQAIFPDNIYSLDSGGDPEIIPTLTWEEFRDFHKRYYQPANARFFFWGDDPEEERLRILNDAIKDAETASPFGTVALQASFQEPREFEFPYAADPGEKRAMFTLNWLLPERGNVEEALKMEMLEHILEGLPGSTLRRALLESGLGEDTTGGGLETDLRQMYYSTGLKGVAAENIAQAEALIMKTLSDLAENGIDEQAVEAAVNSVEFAYRENNSGRLPRGLAAMIQSLSTWLYGEDPLAPLAWEKPLANIKAALARGEKVFENVLRKNFLDNPHRVKVTLLPDETLAAKRLEKEASQVAAIKNAASEEEREAIIRSVAALKATQQAPDKPEDLAKIPALKVEDLPLENARLPIKIQNDTFISHELDTNGVVYTSAMLAIDSLPPHLLPLLPLFARSLTDFGTARNDYSELGMKIAARTGGLAAAPMLGASAITGQPYLYLSFIGKSLPGEVDYLFSLMEEMLLEPQTDPDIILNRLAQMILEDKARLEFGLQSAGHTAVSSRLRSFYRGDGAIAEILGGVSQLWHLRSLEKRLFSDPESLLKDFSDLRKHLVHSSHALIDVAGDAQAISKVITAGEKLLSRLPITPLLSGGAPVASWQPLALEGNGEAFVTQGQVNYVGKGANLYDLGYKFHGSANAITRWLRMGKLWEDVRVTGGAYGAFCTLDRISGNFICASYRDPNVERTLQAYDGLGTYLRNFEPTRAQLSQAIIGAIGDMDAYLLPDAKAAKSLARHLSGLTPEMLQTTREEILSTTTKDFQDFAQILDEAAKKGAISVLGGNSTAKAAEKAGWKKYSLNE